MKMELWIRTQDRMNLVKINQVSLNYQNNKQIIANYIPEIYENSSCYYELLGTYKTKERALEVLDEIEERIMLINTIHIAKDTDSLIACKNVLTEEKIKRLNYPYQMPEK